MSFGEFYKAFSSLGKGYDDAVQQAEARKLLEQQLDTALGAQGATPAATSPLSPLGTPVVAAPQPASQAGRVPSFAGGGTAPLRLPASGENETKFVGALREGGLTNPYGLAALAAYANHESGYKGSNISGSWSDPSERGAPGTSGGILSWRGDRLANMRRFTAGASDPVAAQAKFALTENPDLTMALQRAQSPEEANSLMANAWKFAGYNRPGGENAARLASTRAYVDRLAGMPGSPTSAPAAVASAPVAGGRPALPSSSVAQPSGPARTMPTQVASADDGQADLPAPSAVPAGYQIPGQPQPAAQPDFVPGSVASPAVAQPGSASASTGLTSAAAQRITPAQADNLRAMLRNPVTQGYAAKIIEGLNKPAEFSFQVVGDQLIRTSKDGRAEVVPNITKPPTFQTQKGSDGNDYTFNPQTGQWTRAIQGRGEDTVRTLISPAERSAAGVPDTYTGPAQIDRQGKLSFPGSGQMGIGPQAETDKAGSKVLTERFQAIGDAGAQGRSDLPLIGELRALGDNIGTGAVAAAKARLGEYGIKFEGSGKIEAYNALLDRLTPQQRIPGAGATSDFDARMFKGSLPRLINTPEGNALVTDTLEAVAKDRMARGEIADLALLGPNQGGITQAEAMKRLRDLPSIQGGFAKRLSELQKGGKLSAVPDASLQPRPESPQPGSPTVGTVSKGYRFRGGDPASPQSWEKVL